jgi:radical SAM superfamily enzyme with C-terminal helix-hairpin-helix motif
MKALTTLALVALITGAPEPARAQLGAQQGLVEPNVTADSTLLKLAGMNAAAVEALTGARPLLSIVTVDSILASHGISASQRSALYARMFVHVDLNRGSDAELLLIPGLNAARLKAIKAGRPWKTFEQFRADFGKGMDAAEVARVEQYLFIPIDLNTWTDPVMDSFAGIGVGTRQWKREFAEYRPWTSMEQFRREISKYLRSRPQELRRLERYVIINP